MRLCSYIVKKDAGHDPECVKGFLNWLKTNYKPGIHGEPIDRERKVKASSKSTKCRL